MEDILKCIKEMDDGALIESRPPDKGLRGWNFVLSELILDLMALNKSELLPWDTNKLSEKHVSQLSQSDLALLGRVDPLIEEPTDNGR